MIEVSLNTPDPYSTPDLNICTISENLIIQPLQHERNVDFVSDRLSLKRHLKIRDDCHSFHTVLCKFGSLCLRKRMKSERENKVGHSEDVFQKKRDDGIVAHTVVEGLASFKQRVWRIWSSVKAVFKPQCFSGHAANMVIGKIDLTAETRVQGGGAKSKPDPEPTQCRTTQMFRTNLVYLFYLD